MRLSEHKELKKEIIGLPSKEKDKLLLRLIAKDKVLTEHLHFLLLEDVSDLEARTENIKSQIDNEVNELKLKNQLTAKDNLLILRKLMKVINHHQKVTKSLYEDVVLRVYLLTKIEKKFKYKAYSYLKDYEHMFFNVFLKAVQVTLNKYFKLHEDLQFDLKEEVNALLGEIKDKSIVAIAESLGLPKSV